MPPKEKLKRLHDTLVKDGYDMPDYATFEVDMSDSTKRSNMLKTLVRDGYDMPDEKTFTFDMGFGEKKNLSQTTSNNGGVGVGLTKSQSSAEPTIVELDAADVQAGIPTPDLKAKGGVNDFFVKSVADVDPNFSQYQKSIEVLPNETNLEVAKEIAANKAAYENFANRVVARYDTNTEQYIKKDNQPLKEGDIIVGVPGGDRNKFFEIKDGVPQPTSSPNPLFNYSDKNDATVVGFEKQSDELTDKLRRGSLFRDAGAIGRAIDPNDEYVDDKYPELSGYILDNYKFEGGKTLKPFLDKHPEVAQALMEEIKLSPSKTLTPEGSQEQLSNAIAKAYKLDVADYDVASHPQTNREQLISSMNFLNDSRVRETMAQLEKSQKDSESKINDLKTKIAEEKDPEKKQKLIEQAQSIVDKYDELLEKNKTTISGYETASNFLGAPEQSWVRPLLEKQETGSAILSNSHRFFPTSARQEQEAFEMEHNPEKGDNNVLYLLKKYGHGVSRGAGAIGTLFDKVVNRPFMSDEDRALATRADASGAANLAANLYTNESGRGELMKTAGSVAGILGYGAIGEAAAPAMVFADTYQSSLQEAHRQGLGGAGAQVNAALNGLVMSNLAHIIPNFSKAGGTFKIRPVTLEKIMQGATTKEGIELLKDDIKKYIVDNAGKNLTSGLKTQAEFAALGAATALVNNVTNQLAGTDLNDEIDIEHSVKDALGLTVLNTILGVGKGAALHKNIKDPEVRRKYIEQAKQLDPQIALSALDNLVELNKGDKDVAEFAEQVKTGISDSPKAQQKVGDIIEHEGRKGEIVRIDLDENGQAKNIVLRPVDEASKQANKDYDRLQRTEPSQKEGEVTESETMLGDASSEAERKLKTVGLELEFRQKDGTLSYKNNDTEISVGPSAGGNWLVNISEKTGDKFVLNENNSKSFKTKDEALEYAKQQKDNAITKAEPSKEEGKVDTEQVPETKELGIQGATAKEIAEQNGYKLKEYDGKGEEGGVHTDGNEISINKNTTKGNTTFYIKGVEPDMQGSHTIELPSDKAIVLHEIGHGMFSKNPELGHEILNKLKEYKKTDEFGHPTGYSATADNLFDATMMDMFAFYKLAPEKLRQSQPKAFDLMKEWENKYNKSKSEVSAKTEPKTVTENDEVKLPSQISGGAERTFVFKDGEWKQKVGNELTRVSDKVQQQAQAEFDKANAPKIEVNETETTQVPKPETSGDIAKTEPIEDSEAASPKPPSRPPKEPVEGEGGVHAENPEMSFKKDNFRRARSRVGIDEFVDESKTTHLEQATKAQKTIGDWKEEGTYGENIKDIQERALDPEGSISNQEQFIFAKHVADLDAKVNSIKDVNSPEYNRAFEQYKTAIDAADNIRSKAGRQLGMVARNRGEAETLADVMVDMANDAGVDKLTPEQKAKAEERFKKVDEARKAAEEKANDLEAANKKLAEDLEFERAKKEVQRQKAGRSKPKTKEQFQEERKSIRQSIADKWKEAGAPKTTNIEGQDVNISEAGIIPRIEQLKAIAPEIGKLIRSYLDEGRTNTLEGVRKLLKQDLEEAKISVTDEEVRAYIAGEYNAKKQSRSEIARQLYEIKQEEKLLLELEALQRGEKPKNEKQQIARNAKLKELRQKIDDIKGADAKEIKRLKRLLDLQEELDRVTDRRQKEKPEKGSTKEKELSEEEREIQDKIDEENRKWGEEKDAARRAKNDYKKIETERNRQIEKVEKLKEKLATLESGRLPDTQKRGEPKKDTPEIESLKQEIEVAEKSVRESMAHQKKMEGLEAELDRVKNRQEKQKNPKEKAEILDDEKAIRAEIEAEQSAWNTERKIEKLKEELQRVKDRQKKATTPREKKELSDTERDLLKQIKDEKEVWAKEIEPARKVAQAEKAARKSINDLKDKIANNDLAIKESDKVTSPQLEALRKEQTKLHEQLEQKRKEAKVGKYSDESKFISAANARIKANQKKATELNEKLKKGDFAPDPIKESILQNKELQKRNPKLYDDYVKSQVAKEQAQLDYEKARIDDQMKNRNMAEKAMDFVSTAIETSKGTVAMVDQSVVLVQNLLFSLAHPKKAAGYALKALRDIKNAERFNKSVAQIHNSKWWPIMEKAGLAFYEPRSAKTELTNEVLGGNNNLWNRDITINGKKYSVGKAFARSVDTFSNNSRMYLFKEMAGKLMAEGKTIDNALPEYENAARIANELTGHGTVQKHIAMAAPVVNKIIWSPKMYASTMNILGLGDLIRPKGIWNEAVGNTKSTASKGFYSGLTGAQRKYVAAQVGRALSTVAVLMALNKLQGGDEDLDPRSSGFGSIQRGDKSFPLLGRYGSAIRTLVQVFMNERVLDGKVDELGDKFGDKKALDVGWGSLGRGKMTPMAGAVHDFFLNSKRNYYTKEKMTPLNTLQQLTIPMSFNSIPDYIRNDGVVKGSLEAILQMYGGNIRDKSEYQKASQEVKDQNIRDTYSPEDLDNPTMKHLHDKLVWRPETQERGAYAVPKDKDHPDGFMTEDEYTKFKEQRDNEIEDKIEVVLKSEKYPVEDADGKIEYKKGKDLTKEDLEKEIRIISTNATKNAKEKLGFKQKESSATDSKIRKERNKILYNKK